MGSRWKRPARNWPNGASNAERQHDHRVILPDAQADLLDLQDHMLESWTPELWLAAEQDIFGQLAQVDSGFITGTVVPLFASVGTTDDRTVLSSHHHIL